MNECRYHKIRTAFFLSGSRLHIAYFAYAMRSMVKIGYWIVLASLLSSQVALASTELDEVVKSVQGVCLVPGSQGQKWDIQVLASGDVNVGLKLGGNAGVDAKVAFTKSEWEGVQQVLREQQKDDNDSYRNCVNNITPLFVNKIKESNEQSPKIITESMTSLKLPMSVIGGGDKIVFSPDFIIIFEEMYGGADIKSHRVKIITPENGRIELREGEPVNVAIKGTNYLLKFNTNKSGQQVYTLMNP